MPKYARTDRRRRDGGVDGGGVEVNQSAKDAGCRVGDGTDADGRLPKTREMDLAGKGQRISLICPSVEDYWPPNKGSSKGCDSCVSIGRCQERRRLLDGWMDRSTPSLSLSLSLSLSQRRAFHSRDANPRDREICSEQVTEQERGERAARRKAVSDPVQFVRSFDSRAEEKDERNGRRHRRA